MDEKPQAPEPQANHHRGRLTWFLWVFFLVFVVYTLSIGPAAWLAGKFPSFGPVFGVVYAPVSYLGSHCAPIGKALLWYLRFIWGIPQEL